MLLGRCVYVHAHTGGCVCLCMGRPEDNPGYCSSGVTHLFLRQGLSWAWSSLMILDLLAWEPPGSSLSRLPYHRGDKHTPLTCNFHMVSENQIQKFLLARQAFTNWTVYWVWTSPVVKYLESFNIPRSIVTSTERQVSPKSVVLFNSWFKKVEQKLVQERVLCHPSPAHSTTLSQQPLGAYTHGSNPFIWLECPQHTL